MTEQVKANNSITFDTNIEEFTLNGCVKVVFSPTDLHFVEQILGAFSEIDAIYEQYQKEINQISDDDETAEAAERVYEVSHRADEEIRSKINALFDKDVCTPTIGGRSILMPANGMPVWANLLLAIIDKFDSTLTEEKKKTNPRIEKYTRKYKGTR